MELAPLPVAIPLAVGAVLTALTWIARRRVVEGIAFLTAVTVAVLCFLLMKRALESPFVYWFGGWEPKRGVSLGISFTIDGAGAGLATLVAVLVSAALVFSFRYLDVTGSLFHVLVLVFLAATTGFCLSGDLFNMFVFFELMGVSAYALTGYRIEEGRPLQGALNFAVSNSIGAILILVGIGLLYGRTGALNLAQIGEAIAGAPADGLIVAAFVFITTGFFIKAAVVPWHFWLADAHAVAPTAICVLFSGVMVQLGLFGAARTYWTVFSEATGVAAGALRGVLLGAGVLTALVGAIVCFEQLHLKRLLAFSTVSHVGLFLVGMALLEAHAVAGTFLYVVSHGVVKGAMFMCVGVLLHRFHAAHEIQLKGKGREIWGVGVLFAFGGLLLAGTPPFGPWLGKAIIDEASAPVGHRWIVILFVAVSIITGGAILRAAGRVFIGWSPPDDADEKEFSFDEDEPQHTETHGPHDIVPASMIIPIMVLLIAGAGLGIWGIFNEPAGAAADFFVDSHAYSDLVLNGTEPPPPEEPPHSPVLSSYLLGLTSAVGSVVVAWAALFRHKFPRRLRRRVFRTFDPPIDRLRALHSGHIGDYVTWLTVGLATFGGLIAFALERG